MAQQVIGIGSVANDGTGDPIRTAFGKVNSNFTESYNANRNLQAANPMGALVIDTSKRLNTKSIAVDSTFTFSGAPAAGTWFSMLVTNTDATPLPHALTIPSSYSVVRAATATLVTIPLLSKLLLEWYYDGTTYILFGEALGYITADGFSISIGHNAGATNSPQLSVNIGYNAGSNAVNAGQSVAVGYGAGSQPGGYAGTFVGYLAGSQGGGTSAVGIGYGAMSTAGQGSGNVAIGVHAAETTATLTGTTAIGYHALNSGAASSAQSSVVIGDHAAASTGIAADNCIYLGPFSGINRNKTLWIDGTSASFNSIQPLIYGEFDNKKLTVNGDGLFTRTGSNVTADASAGLEVRSTTQGFLLPRMTKTQRNAISSPATGLAVFQTDNTPGLRVYNGTNWMKYTEAAD